MEEQQLRKQLGALREQLRQVRAELAQTQAQLGQSQGGAAVAPPAWPGGRGPKCMPPATARATAPAPALSITKARIKAVHHSYGIAQGQGPQSRAAAAESLGVLGGNDPGVAEALEALEKNDKDLDVQRAASDALSIIWGK